MDSQSRPDPSSVAANTGCATAHPFQFSQFMRWSVILCNQSAVRDSAVIHPDRWPLFRGINTHTWQNTHTIQTHDRSRNTWQYIIVSTRTLTKHTIKITSKPVCGAAVQCIKFLTGIVCVFLQSWNFYQLPVPMQNGDKTKTLCQLSRLLTEGV